MKTIIIIAMLLKATMGLLSNQTVWVALEAMGTIVTAIIAAVAAVYGYRQYKEMQRDRRPYIIVDFELSGHIIEVVTSNIGNKAAKNVQFLFDPELIASDGRNLSKSFWLFKQGARFLPPDKKISTIFDTFRDDPKSGRDLIFHVSVFYQDMQGNPLESHIDLDLSMYKGLRFIQRKGIDDVVNTLEKIEGHIQKALSPLGRGGLVETQEGIERQLGH